MAHRCHGLWNQGRGDNVLRGVERHECPVELTLIALIAVPDSRRFLVVDGNHGPELDHVVMRSVSGPHYVRAAARTCVVVSAPSIRAANANMQGRRPRASDPPSPSRSAPLPPAFRWRRRTGQEQPDRAELAGREYSDVQEGCPHPVSQPTGSSRSCEKGSTSASPFLREGEARQNSLVDEKLDNRATSSMPLRIRRLISVRSRRRSALRASRTPLR